MHRKNILITGATGNIGSALFNGFREINCYANTIAADYLHPDNPGLKQYSADTPYRQLDFEKPEGFDKALQDIDIVFLLRPPHLADIKRVFAPFLEAMKRNSISKIVFLSVQGAESQSFIPHHKLEKLILSYGMEYVFLRPSYFMQNLTTTLLYDIRNRGQIFIPSSRLKFNWVDAHDIGLVGACVLSDFDRYKNQALEITGKDFAGMDEAVSLINHYAQTDLRYVSPNLLHFYRVKRKQGMPPAMIFVMIMLHFLPRLGKNKPRLTNIVKEVTGKEPVSLEEFIKREAQQFLAGLQNQT